MAEEKRYYSIVTDVGTAAITNAALSGQKVNITELAVGDGGGGYYRPTSDMTRLKGEKWRGAIASYEKDSLSDNIVVVKAIVPYNVGGFTIREMGLFDNNGNLITIENLPDMEKVKSESGASFDLEITSRIVVSNNEAIDFKFDPTTVIATKRNIEEHNASKFAHSALFGLKADKDLRNVSPEALIQALENAGISTSDIDCGLFTDPDAVTLVGTFKVGEYCVGQMSEPKSDVKTVKNGGTVWIDNVTPVNAQNMNKIESKLTELENTKVTKDNIHLIAEEF